MVIKTLAETAMWQTMSLQGPGKNIHCCPLPLNSSKKTIDTTNWKILRTGSIPLFLPLNALNIDGFLSMISLF